MFTQKQIEEMFTYQTPTVAQVKNMQYIRNAAKELAHVIRECSKACPDQSAAIRKLREVVTSANQAVIFGGKY